MEIKHIPFSRPYLGDEELKYVKQVLESGWISRGPETKKVRR